MPFLKWHPRTKTRLIKRREVMSLTEGAVRVTTQKPPQQLTLCARWILLRRAECAFRTTRRP